MVESSIGISAGPLIAEESIVDPVVGLVTGISFGLSKIVNKIRNKNKDDYTIDALTNEEEKKEPTREDMMSGWRDARSRDAQRRQAVQVDPHQLPPDDLEMPQEEGYGWNDIIPQANPPAQVIEQRQTRDHLDLVPRDVQIPLEEQKQPQPQFIDDEEEFENRQFGRPDPGGNDPNGNNPNPGGNDPNNGGNGGGNDPDPNGNNQQPEEQKNNPNIQNNPLFNNAVNQIVDKIDALKKQKDNEEQKKDDDSGMTDAERQRYIADIEVQIRSQQQLIDLLNKFSQGQIDAKQVNTELDQIQELIQAEKIQQFTEDYVFADIVETF